MAERPERGQGESVPCAGWGRGGGEAEDPASLQPKMTRPEEVGGLCPHRCPRLLGHHAPAAPALHRPWLCPAALPFMVQASEGLTMLVSGSAGATNLSAAGHPSQMPRDVLVDPRVRSPRPGPSSSWGGGCSSLLTILPSAKPPMPVGPRRWEPRLKRPHFQMLYLAPGLCVHCFCALGSGPAQQRGPNLCSVIRRRREQAERNGRDLRLVAGSASDELCDCACASDDNDLFHQLKWGSTAGLTGLLGGRQV